MGKGIRKALWATVRRFPWQFWLLFVGMFLATVGASMVWPFLALFLAQRLRLPLAQVGALLSINAAMSLVAAVLGGALVDVWGRKRVMVFSLLGVAGAYLGLGWSRSWWAFAVGIGSCRSMPSTQHSHER